MSEPKLCIDCKHYSRSATFDCRRPTGETSLVHGRPTYEVTMAVLERRDRYGCGPEGSFWEPRVTYRPEGPWWRRLFR